MAVYLVDGDSFDFVEGYAAADLYTKAEINKLWYVNASAVALDVEHISAEILCIGNYLGTISASSSASSIATVAVSGKKVNIYGKATGTATVTITDSFSGTSKTVAVTVAANFPSATLNNNTPAQIQAAARAGVASQLWSVGDRIGIAFNGTVGKVNMNATRYVYILGFNHNASVEGSNTIHFQLGFSALSSGVNIAYCDSGYGETATSGFVMNATAINSGGWAASAMRSSICAQFLAAMPEAWQGVLSGCVKYSDNVGGISGAISNMSATVDKIFLLSQYEAQGATGNVNAGESVYQKQYDYYANGNSRIKYKHNATGTTAIWWLRSTDIRYSDRFRTIAESGGSNPVAANYSYGFAPAFMVA